jgi:hypothetical protein
MEEHNHEGGDAPQPIERDVSALISARLRVIGRETFHPDLQVFIGGLAET